MATILERILARRDLDSLRVVRDLDGITAKLNAEGVKIPRQRFITARVVRTLPNGKEILAALKGARSADDDIDLAYTFLMQEAGLDIGDPTTLGLIDILVAKNIFQPSWGEQVKALAMVPVIVDRLEVEAALMQHEKESA